MQAEGAQLRHKGRDRGHVGGRGRRPQPEGSSQGVHTSSLGLLGKDALFLWLPETIEAGAR